MEENDEELQDEVATRAADLMFLAPLLEPNDNPPMHHVRTREGPGGFGQYVVQIRMSGKQRFIGYKISEPEIACRFADMATLRFRKYIKRVKWNFSESQAIADTKNDEENGGQLAVFLLDRRENIWKRDGIILKEVARTPAKQKSNRRTVESRLANLESRLAALEAPTVTVPPITTNPIQPTPVTIWTPHQ